MTVTETDDQATISGRPREVADALALLTDRYDTPTSRVGPSVDAVAMAWTMTHDVDGQLRADVDTVTVPDLDEIRAALLLVPRYLDDATATQATLIRAARTIDPATGKPHLTWMEIGLLLGFQPGSSKQRAFQLAQRLGLGPNLDPDET